MNVALFFMLVFHTRLPDDLLHSGCDLLDYLLLRFFLFLLFLGGGAWWCHQVELFDGGEHEGW